MRAPVRVLVAVVLAVVGVGAGLGIAQAPLPSDGDWRDGPAARGALFERVLVRLRDAYVDPALVDWPTWRARFRPSVEAATTRAALDAAFVRAFAGLNDGHSRWVGRLAPLAGPPPAPERPPSAPVVPGAPGEGEPAPPRPPPERAPSDGDRPADGAPASNADARPSDPGLEAVPIAGTGWVVLRAHPGGAADAAGVRRGDVITAVGDVALTGAPPPAGPRGVLEAALRDGPVDVRVASPRREVRTVRFVPTALPDGAERAPLVRLDAATGVARVDLPAFDAGTAAALHPQLRRAREAGARGWIVDLRGNVGGSVLQLGLVLGAWTTGTQVAAWRADAPTWRLEVTRSPADGHQRLAATLRRASGPRAGTVRAQATLDAPATVRGPVAVLTDGATASAAEAAADALAQAVGARVVGTRTAGNVETVRRLGMPGGNAAWVAVAELRRPDGTRFAPVAPDVRAEVDPRALARGFDRPAAEATAWLRGVPTAPGRWF